MHGGGQMDRCRRNFLLCAAALSAARVLPAQASSSLKFGVVPYLTARRLATLYEPVRTHFERQLGLPVHFSSAPDYATHLDRLRAHEYDLVADSLPLARLAQTELGYVPIARTRVPLQPILVVARETPIADLAAFRGRTIAVSDRLAALTLIGLRYLRDQGLRPNKDVSVRVAGSHVNAIQLVLAGDAVAAVVSKTTLRQIDSTLSGRVRVMRELPEALSAVVYTACPRLAGQAEGIGKALLGYATTDPAGIGFIESLGHQGLLPVGGEMAGVDVLVTEFYRQLSYSE